ncbi:MAG TPA: PaaI family thioesterase [Mycobacterium sp.]
MATTEEVRAGSPVHDRLQISVVRQEPGHVTMSMPLTDDIRGYFEGSIHGGVLATFADIACAFCLEGCYDFGREFTVTTDMHNRYFRQPQGGPLVAEATMVHRGRRVMSAECSIADAANRILVRSTATYMVIPTDGMVVASSG